MLQPFLSEIVIYPAKSMAGIALSHSWVEEKGLSFDRRFVLADSNGQFITARTDPALCLIQPVLMADGVRFSAPGQTAIKVDYQQIITDTIDVTVWRDTITAQRCAEAVNQWFSSFLNKPCQLLFFGANSKRRVKNRHTQLSFADGYPLLLTSTASLAELNRTASTPTIMRQFRPNLVVDQTDAFAEDSWKLVQIGDVKFEVSKPCTRCIFTTVNPNTGEFHPNKEPLSTLQQFRRAANGDINFGQNLIALNEGRVAVGDRLEVLAWQTPEFYPDARLLSPTPALTSTPQAASKVVWHESVPISLTCQAIVDETADVKTFYFSHHLIEQFHYLAGQHLPIVFTVNGEKVARNYTLSSSPSRPDHLAITVKRVADGRISNFLHDQFKVGDSISAKPPAGQFYRQQTTLPLVFITAGSGITPALSMLRDMADKLEKRPVVFIHSAQTEQDLIAYNEINKLAARLSHCQCYFTLTKQVMPSWSGWRDRLSVEHLSTISQIANSGVFLCGPAEFMQSIKTSLLSLGVKADNIYQESFGVRSKAEKVKAKTVNILFDSWDKQVVGNDQQSILEQGEAAGLILPYSCRGGYCGSCKVKLEQGDVSQLSTDGLTIEEQNQGQILACSCMPKSDVVISAV